MYQPIIHNVLYMIIIHHVYTFLVAVNVYNKATSAADASSSSEAASLLAPQVLQLLVRAMRQGAYPHMGNINGPGIANINL